MTRKHFETIAISLGGELRQTVNGSAPWYTILGVARVLASDLRTVNPRFDEERFLEYVLDVAEYRRNLDGKKVAA